MAKLTGSRYKLGMWGERAAATHLGKAGYEILDRNVRTPYGELDLVARLGNVLVFVEVKTRTNTEFGSPEESITTQKASHLLQSAQAYMLANHLSDIDWRIDVVTIYKSKGHPPIVAHIENAIH